MPRKTRYFDSDFKVYAVRHIDDKQAVGIFWAHDLDELARLVDYITEPFVCEFHEIIDGGGFGWDSVVPGFGTPRHFDRPEEPNESIGDEEIDQLRRKIDFFGSAEDFVYDEVRNWEPLDPDGGPPKPIPRQQKIETKPLAAASTLLSAPKSKATNAEAPNCSVYLIESGGFVKRWTGSGPDIRTSSHALPRRKETPKIPHQD